ncbi:unnamed protein product [Camellia sinensis]
MILEVPVVSFIVNRLGDLLIEEAKFLYGVSNQVQQIRIELNRMQCFLQEADYAIQSYHHVDVRVDNWVAEVRKLAYETEDILETYVIEVSSKRSKRGFRKNLKRFACILNEGQDVHRLGCEIGAIKDKITDLAASLQTYGMKCIGEGIRSSTVEKQQELRQSYQHVLEEDFVGFKEDLNKVVKHLVQVDDYSPSRVVSIYGMGGLGKTTLAKKVYHHQDVQNHFDYLAWVCISQQYQTRDILQRIFIKLVPERNEEVVRMRNEELFEQLYEVQLSKKCLVVLDDIWSIEAWKSLKPAFPDRNMGSKILLTTRNKALSSQIDPYCIFHEPQCLNDEESWDLLQKKSLLRRDGRDAGVLDTNMEAIGRKMVKLCAGLPLAIIVLGGLLATRHTLREWEVVYQNVCSHKWSDDPTQCDNGVSMVLALSYHDLPYQLKPCFLYFGHFPEDYKVDAERLYHLWIADGIIVDDDRVGDETIMDVAKRYLGALAQRCMVQVQVENYTERINYCRIHDLMLELCLSKAKVNDFLGIIHLQCETDLANCFSTTTSTTTAPKIRKLAIHLNRDVERVVLPELETTKHLRSILFCNSRSVNKKSSIELNSHLKYFKLLRNLDLEAFKFDEKSIESIGNLISLRYLRFRDCLIPKWHSSICKLKHLQTLDLRHCKFNSGEVIVIHRMEQLRHLYIQLNLNVKLKFDGLSNLETLGGFNTGSCDVNDLCKLINLRQLEDATFLKVHNQDLAAFINYLSIGADHLRKTSLSVEFCKKEEEELTLLKQLLGCHHLYRLSIRGIIPELPEYCQGFSSNLIELTLEACQLEEDPMPTLERLPNLQFLYLGGAFVGDKMVCSANGFPQLKTLYLYWLQGLKEWEVEKGAMPNLSSLEINLCRGLEMVPEGLRFIATLQRFRINNMSENFHNKLRKVNGEKGEDFYKVRHLSSLNIIRVDQKKHKKKSGNGRRKYWK